MCQLWHVGRLRVKSGFLLGQVLDPLTLKGLCLIFRLYLKIMTQVKVPRLFLDWFRFFRYDALMRVKLYYYADFIPVERSMELNRPTWTI